MPIGATNQVNRDAGLPEIVYPPHTPCRCEKCDIICVEGFNLYKDLLLYTAGDCYPYEGVIELVSVINGRPDFPALMEKYLKELENSK